MFLLSSPLYLEACNLLFLNLSMGVSPSHTAILGQSNIRKWSKMISRQNLRDEKQEGNLPVLTNKIV